MRGRPAADCWNAAPPGRRRSWWQILVSFVMGLFPWVECYSRGHPVRAAERDAHASAGQCWAGRQYRPTLLRRLLGRPVVFIARLRPAFPRRDHGARRAAPVAARRYWRPSVHRGAQSCRTAPRRAGSGASATTIRMPGRPSSPPWPAGRVGDMQLIEIGRRGSMRGCRFLPALLSLSPCRAFGGEHPCRQRAGPTAAQRSGGGGGGVRLQRH